MKISKKSSLYFLCRMGWMSPSRWNVNTNLCAVFWHSMWGLVMTAALIAAASAFGYVLLLQPIVSVIGFIATGLWAPSEFAIIGLLVDSIIAAVAAIGFAVIKWDEKRREDPLFYEKQAERDRQRRENPGFIRTAYRSWKEKTCVLITFEDKA
jgi:hypothetical protein